MDDIPESPAYTDQPTKGSGGGTREDKRSFTIEMYLQASIIFFSCNPWWPEASEHSPDQDDMRGGRIRMLAAALFKVPTGASPHVELA